MASCVPSPWSGKLNESDPNSNAASDPPVIVGLLVARAVSVELFNVKFCDNPDIEEVAVTTFPAASATTKPLNFELALIAAAMLEAVVAGSAVGNQSRLALKITPLILTNALS